MLAEKLPELLDFPKDLVSLEGSTKVSLFILLLYQVVLVNSCLDFCVCQVTSEYSIQIQLKYLAEEMQAISKGLEKVIQELSASENDGPVSENFCQVQTKQL